MFSLHFIITSVASKSLYTKQIMIFEKYLHKETILCSFNIKIPIRFGICGRRQKDKQKSRSKKYDKLLLKRKKVLHGYLSGDMT